MKNNLQDLEDWQQLDFVHLQLVINGNVYIIQQVSFRIMLTGSFSPIWIIGSAILGGQSVSNVEYKIESISDDFPHLANHECNHSQNHTITYKDNSNLIRHNLITPNRLCKETEKSAGFWEFQIVFSWKDSFDLSIDI